MPSAPLEAPPFECRCCGDCCRGFGGTYVSEADMARIAAFIGVDAADFRQRFCQPSGRRWVLAQADSGYCVFWDRLCTIHPVKPRMCRQWPFIRPVLRDPQNWRSMATSCPGMRSDLSEEAILAAVRPALDNGGD